MRNTPISSRTTNVLTIDLEEWFHAETFARVLSRQEWPNIASRAAPITRRLLALLAKNETLATFFVLGAVANELPELVREIASAGHEIGSHGWSHRPIWDLERTDFVEEITASRLLLQQLSGQPVLGYRAPTFSVTARTLWALDELARAGYGYDSSIFPIHHDRYGIPDAQTNIYRHDNGLWEIPMSVIQIGKLRVPVAGGGYLRLYPFLATRLAIRRLNSAGNPAVVYIHPWEFDPGQPRQPLSPVARFRHTVGIGRNEGKLVRLLTEFRFESCIAALGHAQNGQPPTQDRR